MPVTACELPLGTCMLAAPFACLLPQIEVVLCERDTGNISCVSSVRNEQKCRFYARVSCLHVGTDLHRMRARFIRKVTA